MILKASIKYNKLPLFEHFVEYADFYRLDYWIVTSLDLVSKFFSKYYPENIIKDTRTIFLIAIEILNRKLGSPQNYDPSKKYDVISRLT